MKICLLGLLLLWMVTGCSEAKGQQGIFHNLLRLFPQNLFQEMEKRLRSLKLTNWQDQNLTQVKNWIASILIIWTIDVYLKFRLSRKQGFVEEAEDFENYPKSSYLGGLSRKVQQA